MSPIGSGSVVKPADTVLFSALRAVLRDNSGHSGLVEKAFRALPSRSQLLDVRV